MQPNKALFHVLTLAVTACLHTAAAATVITAPDLSAAPGSSGEFNVLLIANEYRPFLVGAFSFDILSSSPLLQFTNASTRTSVPYIFAGDSFDQINGFPLATTTGQDLRASDAPNNGFASVGFSATLSLGEVFYTISPSAPLGSTISITFGPETSLADPAGNGLGITTVNGEISVAAIPEPVQFPLILGTLAFVALARMRLRLR